MSRRPRRTFTTEFKAQIVALYENGKSRKDIIVDYDLNPSTFDKWVKQHHQSGSFKEKDNRTPQEQELLDLKKKNQQLMMENDILKPSGADIRMRIQVIKDNRHKYPIAAMCRCLNVPRSTYYYEATRKKEDVQLEQQIQTIFRKSRNSYGTRRIKEELEKLDKRVSRRRIAQKMTKLGLISTYTIAHFKPKKSQSNESAVKNVLNQKFTQETPLTTIVSDLTYVRVAGKWHYICTLVDLYNREIVGYSSGPRKDAELVKRAFQQVQRPLTDIQLFHTDRGNEFDNQLIDRVLEGFQIQRSLSKKGYPYDNAVAESLFKTLKVEFIYQYSFNSQEQLSRELFDYVHWYNTKHLHSTLNYQSPVAFRIHNQQGQRLA
ncbi:IS3 family transposase [Enterococcus sp. AZ170]|uniref:IS3 family transposase n=1 Tax=Enterococcus sp. AZ170 TaxID=2774747 RepID=UPI003D2FEE19